jgi:hypothetical protein
MDVADHVFLFRVISTIIFDIQFIIASLTKSNTHSIYEWEEIHDINIKHTWSQNIKILLIYITDEI